MQINLLKLLLLLRPIFIFLLAWWLIAFCIFRPPMVLRFENSVLNYWGFVFLALAIPVSLFWLATKYLKRTILRGLIHLFAVMSVFPVVIAVLFTLLDIRNFVLDGVDHSYEKISELKVDSDYYRLYRTNGGATTAYDLSLRKEKPLGNGLMLVKSINGFDAYKAHKGQLQRLSQNKIRLIFLIGGDEKEHVYDFEL